MVLFKNPRDSSQIMHLVKQMYPGKTGFLKAIFQDATSEPYGYLFTDFKQNTPDHFRLRTQIFSELGVGIVSHDKNLQNID